MYINNKSGNQITNDEYNKLSPKMKARYSKDPEKVAEKPKTAKQIKAELAAAAGESGDEGK